MTLRLNDGGFKTAQAPATVQIFTDSGSLAHFVLGMFAGSELLNAKDSVIALGAFSAYQMSQAECGEPWGRIGGELLEFVLGMFLVRLLPMLLS
jgi:hypothetical protein